MLKKNKKLYLTLGFALMITFLFISGFDVTAEESIEKDFSSMGQDMMKMIKVVLMVGLVIGGFIIYKVQKNR